MIKVKHLGDGKVNFKIKGNTADITFELASLMKHFSENEELCKLFNVAKEMLKLEIVENESI